MSHNIIDITYDFVPPQNMLDYIFLKLPKDEILSIEELQEITESVLSKFPEPLLFKMKEEDWKIVITNTRNLEKENNVNYDIYGITNFDTKTISLYAKKDAIVFGLPHEIGHYVDNLLGFISSNDEWKEIFAREIGDVKMFMKTNAVQYSKFFTSYDTENEFFAECFSAYIMLNNDEKFFHDNLLRTRKIMERIEKIISLPNIPFNSPEKSNDIDINKLLYHPNYEIW